ncbi:PDR/VanB family oxidoreductase [Nonomuraea wenchangensis]|uniref:Vanillate O-demethylase ferredoxin subunit n=1 Tax=Nonomuraea wenchangensis TaxID=568860 RepID=A0A1I0LB80_9ACTN|nr:PDR/VanB family oxidoreductase [Nonomuraea wenchangensis]SEU37410.1 vanillate O-demethylase ferredoxin subunit [Nonomuraea wenchangensis]
MSQSGENLTVRVQAVRWEADSVFSYELRRPDGAPLPPFTAGAHIDLHLGNGFVRSYSLCGDQDEPHRYVVAVNRDANSRGGSSWIHDHLHVGRLLEISPPLNNFALAEDAERSLLIAGGVGITPILSMVRRLSALGRDWTLHLAARTRGQAAFLDELTRLAGDRPDRVRLHVDDENDGELLDLEAVLAEVDDATHVYCCGPLPMLDTFEKAAAGVPAERRHVEYFAAKDAPATEGGFQVELTRSGKTLAVPQGATILDTLLGAGVDVSYSCTEGVCGTCETRVISGVPDHRDLVLTDQEKESNEIMMICCSGSKSARLVLEL